MRHWTPVRAERSRLIDERQAHFEMLSQMSHELRTLLNAILGFAEVIQSEMMGPAGGARAYSDYAGLIPQQRLRSASHGRRSASHGRRAAEDERGHAGPVRGRPAHEGQEPVEDLHRC